jgi:hypothetical protein
VSGIFRFVVGITESIFNSLRYIGTRIVTETKKLYRELTRNNDNRRVRESCWGSY